MAAKEEGERNAHTTMRFIQYFNKKPLSELRTIDVVYRVSIIVEISKVVKKEDAEAKAEECIERVLKDVVGFDLDFQQRV